MFTPPHHRTARVDRRISFVIGHQVTDVVANREQAAALVPA
jgi:hypothetical protein